MNLTDQVCSTLFLKPNTQSKCTATNINWVYTNSKKDPVFAVSCHAKGLGDVPGYYSEKSCIFEYGSKQYSTQEWSRVGVYNGGFKLCANKYACRCAVYGGYQNGHDDPLYFCVGEFNGRLIPGKVDVKAKYCWFGNTGSVKYYTIVGH